MVDEYSKSDDEREAAWKTLRNMPDDVRNENVRTLSKLPDSAQGPVSQSDAQRIKDAAYEEYAANLRDAFRTLK